MAGETLSFGNSFDAWIVKLDCRGNVQWQRSYGRQSIYDGIHSIQQTNDGGYIVAGGTESVAVGTTWDAWVLKLDSNGNVQWQKTYGENRNGFAYSIQQTADGGYIVAGDTEAIGANTYFDVWVLKLDSSGNVQWQKAYGGPYHDQGRSIRQTSDGGYILAGDTQSFGTGDHNAWLTKLAANGDIQWGRQLGDVANIDKI